MKDLQVLNKGLGKTATGSTALLTTKIVASDLFGYSSDVCDVVDFLGVGVLRLASIGGKGYTPIPWIVLLFLLKIIRVTCLPNPYPVIRGPLRHMIWTGKDEQVIPSMRKLTAELHMQNYLDTASRPGRIGTESSYADERFPQNDTV